MTLYALARNICLSRAGMQPPDSVHEHGRSHAFCEECLEEAMQRWDGVARLIAETYARARNAEHQLDVVDELLRRCAPPGCLPAARESVITTAQRVLRELRSS